MLNGGPHIDEYGIQRWFRDGQRHREDGPAEIWPSDTKIWWRNGVIHREDGPAEERADGTKGWFRHGELHREDGPAREWADGVVGWHLNGTRLGCGAEGFWAHWKLLNYTQRCNLNLHKWLAKYT